jgi:uncharacterized protein (DUF302 family)
MMGKIKAWKTFLSTEDPMSTDTAKYGLFRELPDIPFDTAKERITEELAKEGFGILTEIDVQDTLKQKIDVEFPPYMILGACNPHLAHLGLMKEPALGLLLPCNVVVAQGEEGGSIVSVMDPYAMVKMTENFDLEDLANEARGKLKRAIAAV